MAESIGQQLQQARQARSLTLEEVARATHVRVHYLQALEAGDLGAVPSLAQARGFLRIYADHLGLDAKALLSDLEGKVVTPPLPAEPAAPVAPAEPPIIPVIEHEAPPAVDPAIAAAAFTEIGQRLRSQREVLGLSLEDVERHTRLRTFFLKALEAGDFDRLPSPVQGRGMLSNYAEFLGMDPEPLLLRFADGLQARLAARQAARPKPPRLAPMPVRPPSPLRRFFSKELLVGGSLVILLAAFALWAAIRIFAMRGEQQPAPTAPSIAAILLATPSEVPTSTALPPTATIPAPATALLAEPTLGATPPPAGTEAVQVYITVRERAWIRVLVDGELAFEGRVAPGSAYQYSGEDKVEILTGNGAAIQVFYNQSDLGPMGLFGEVVHQVFTRQGVQTPTPTITVTPSATERPTATQRGAPTGTPTGALTSVPAGAAQGTVVP